jgi:beta-lactamase regulating signal transducer with metallopeptidase domain
MNTLEQMVLSNAVVATVLALLASAVGLFSRRPALVHSLWLLVLIKLITPPICRVEVFQLPTPPKAEAALQAKDFASQPVLDTSDLRAFLNEREPSEACKVDDAPIPVCDEPALSSASSLALSDLTTSENALNWSFVRPLLWSVWLTGSLGCLFVAAIRVVRFQLLLRWAEPASDELQDRVQLLAECLGLTSVPVVWMVPGPVSPMIWPIGLRPRLLIPHGLLDRLSAEQRDTLLAHELAHLRRRDHWVRGLELLVTGLFWWHPIVWWGRQAIREAEEECCDAWVMWALPASSRAYASALVEALDFLAGARPAMLPPAACGLGQFQTLKRRLTMILTGSPSRSLPRLGFLAVLGLGFLMPVLPTWGRADDKDDDEKKIEQKDFIKKITKDAIKKVDVEAIKKEVRDAIGKDMNLDIDLGNLGDLKVDLNLDLEGLLAEVDEALQEGGGGAKDLNRARSEIQRAMAQVERAKAQFERAQAGLQKAQAKLAELEAATKDGNKLDLDKMKKAKALKDLGDKVKEDHKPKEKLDKQKIELKEFAKKRTEGRNKQDDLEMRLEKIMREVQDLSKDLKRRKSADKDEDDE